MKLSPKKQQGMTLISMACVATVVIFMFLMALNIVPIYMDHGKVTGALDSIKNNPETKSETPEELLTRLFKLLGINNADTLFKREDVIIARQEDGSTEIHIQYEVTKKLVGNASILVQFDDTVRIK
jgi:hypothetical protein